MPYSSNKLFTMYGTKKAVHDGGLCAFRIKLFDVAKMRKVFGMCKGEGRKCVAEHVFCGKRKGSRVGGPWRVLLVLGCRDDNAALFV